MALSDIEIEELESLCCQVRQDVLTMVYTARSGHPGGNLSAVELMVTLYKKCMKHFPEGKKHPDYENRDRFILSKGHASATLYSVLAHCGYFSTDKLTTFRQLGSKLQGHPSRNHLDCIEVSTGSLGQGLSMACGTALGLKLNKSKSKVYAYVGDGELQEGSIWEAFMSAAHYKLDNLIVFIDRNRLQIDAGTETVMSLDDLDKKLEAFNWSVIEIDGHDIFDIFNAIEVAQNSDKPTAIIANTVKGKGVSFMENNVGWHGKAPNKEEYEKAMEELRGESC